MHKASQEQVRALLSSHHSLSVHGSQGYLHEITHWFLRPNCELVLHVNQQEPRNNMPSVFMIKRGRKYMYLPTPGKTKGPILGHRDLVARPEV